MKKIYRLTLSVIGLGMALLPGKSWAQTGIGTGGSAPNTSAMLEVQSASKGLLIPRLSLSSVTDAVTIASPATSLLVWNTNNSLTAGVGYYFNAGTPSQPNWVKLVTNAPGDGTGNEWKLGGNTAGTENQLGTNDAYDLPLVTNGTEKARLTKAGQFGIGTATPKSTLEVNGSLGANYSNVTDATYAVTTTDFYVVYHGTSAATFTLPTAVGVKGRLFFLKNATSNQVLTLKGQSGESINGSSTITVPAGQSVQLIASGASAAGLNSYEIVAFNSATTIGGPQSASNGLNLVGTDIQLGGALTKNTTIDGGTSTYTLGLTNTNLGVGIGSPGANIHIYGATTSGSPGGTGAELLLGTGTLTKGASVQVAHDGAYGSSLLFNVKQGTNQGVTGADNWPTNTVTAMRVGSAGGGNVGIGTFTTAAPVNPGAILHLRNSNTSGTQQQGFLPPTVDFTSAVFTGATTWGLAGSPVNGMLVNTNTTRTDNGFSGPGTYVWTVGTAGTPTIISTWRRIEYGVGQAPALGTLTCGTTSPVPTGLYLSGQALTTANAIIVPVNITQIGTYAISTAVVNGYSFTGLGTFANTGPQNITLTASGTPTNAGTDNFSVSLGGQTCSFNVAVGGQLATINSLDCTTGTTATGTYQSTTPTTSANTKVITVNVTAIGAYSFATNTVNGFSFSATGTFTSTGSKPVTLLASGTPQTGGGGTTNTFTVTPASGMSTVPSTCTFTVPVIAAPVVASLTNCATPGVDYRIRYTRAVNSGTDTWIYPNGDGTAAGTNIVITNSSTNVNRQWALMPTGTTNEYTLVNGGGTLVLSVAGASTTSGANLQLGDYTGATNQRFVVTPVVAANSTFALPNLFTLTPTNATGLRMNVSNSGTANGTAVIAYTASPGAGNEQFYIEPVATTLTAGTAVTGTTNRFTIAYTAGNGGSYAAQTISSTGVTGLTATRTAGVLNGNATTQAPGFVSYVITGTPTFNMQGNATFEISIGSTKCSVNLPVVLQDAVATTNCNGATTSPGVATGTTLTTASGVNTTIPYTGGNSGKYSAISITSTGITGLTATAPAGTIATGAGNLVLNITGTPSGDGVASFVLPAAFGGTACTFTVQVTRTPEVASLSCTTASPNYKLRFADNSGYYVAPAGTTVGGAVVQTTSTSSLWQLVNMGSGNYYIRNMATGYVIDANGTASGTNVRNQNANGGPYQLWTLTTLSGSPFVAGGVFQFLNVAANKNLDAGSNVTRSEGTVMTISDATAANPNQPFSLEAASTLTAGTNSTGYNVTIGYTGGNGADYPAMSGITTTSNSAITGLTMSLAAGTLAGTVASPQPGFLTFTITGTPSGAGIASFPFLFGGKNCTVTVATGGPASVSSLSCGSGTTTGTLSAGVAASGVSESIPYSGGNTGQYGTISATSTGVNGLTATAPAGSVASGSGNIVFSISGVPDGGGTASFNFTLAGKSCSFTIPVTAGTVQSIANLNEPGLDYNIKLANSTWYLYPKANGTTQSTAIAITSAITGLNRQWAVVNTGSGYALLNQGGQGYVMDIANGKSTTNSNAVQLFAWNNGATSQRWVPTPLTAGASIYNSAIYLYPFNTTSYRLDLNAGTLSNDNIVQIYANNPGVGQQFTLVPVTTLFSGQAVSGYNVTYNYTGGSGTYAAQSVASSAANGGVTGLTATLAAGNFNANGGNSFLTYVISGTPSKSGTATFALTIGGQAVTLTLQVN